MLFVPLPSLAGMIFMHAEECLLFSLLLDLGVPGGLPVRNVPPTLLFPIHYDTLKVHHVLCRGAELERGRTAVLGYILTKQ